MIYRLDWTKKFFIHFSISSKLPRSAIFFRVLLIGHEVNIYNPTTTTMWKGHRSDFGSDQTWAPLIIDRASYHISLPLSPFAAPVYAALNSLQMSMMSSMEDNHDQMKSSIPPGFRFHPTEEELVGYYLTRKINSLEIDLDVIVEIDLYRMEPWDIQG